MKKLKVAILGSGNIGTDLLVKTMRSQVIECTLFIGRHLNSPGMNKANSMGVKTSDLSIEAIERNPDSCDLVFDATSALDHKKHWAVLKKMNKTVIDMTPSGIGEMCIPAINIENCLRFDNLNMVTCGGQASIPIAHVIGKTQENVRYIEVVSSIASRSAGPATRLNLDEYVETTEKGIKKFSGCDETKAILILNPAQPCVDMQTTIFAKVEKPDMKRLRAEVDTMVSRIQEYVPGYTLLVSPLIESNRIVIMVKVQGLGDYLPKYAGNMDIINCAAIAMAERYARKTLTVPGS
ncbi:MAG: acetaldehyde dehydrogenase (acetylating) [Methanoregula sp.]|jgi:acetaldehyde dehydrogenase|uniref:acetaldehyde dehydrogenase (acetylating) n=1 Tax=Methanoregula sp. TaxID=2052170 RepID=UPI003D0EB1F5